MQDDLPAKGNAELAGFEALPEDAFGFGGGEAHDESASFEVEVTTVMRC